MTSRCKRPRITCSYKSETKMLIKRHLAEMDLLKYICCMFTLWSMNTRAILLNNNDALHVWHNILVISTTSYFLTISAIQQWQSCRTLSSGKWSGSWICWIWDFGLQRPGIRACGPRRWGNRQPGGCWFPSGFTEIVQARCSHETEG